MYKMRKSCIYHLIKTTVNFLNLNHNNKVLTDNLKERKNRKADHDINGVKQSKCAV
jgi:hypothetical protein